MSPEFLIGHRIHLRGIRESEIAEGTPYYSWMNDLSLDIFTERSYSPTTPEKMRAYFERIQRYDDLIQLGIFDNESGKHIGNIAFNEINARHRRAYIGYLLGDLSFVGKGIITDAVLMMMYWGFSKLNFERIHGGVRDGHAASMRVCEKVGLVVEGRQRSHFLRNGVYYDDIIVGALRQEWIRDFGDRAKKLFVTPPA